MPTGEPTEELRQPPEPGRGGGRARSPGVVIRHERPGDAAEIAAIIAEAFDGHPYSQGREASIVANLRRAKALVISLVAQTSAGLAGHIAFSRVMITGAGAGWYGLGPLAVAPALQQRGIGQLLVRRGLAELRTLGARGCVLLGDGRYYGRFGFQPWPGLTLEGALREQVLGLPFCQDEPRGEIAYHSAFYETAVDV